MVVELDHDASRIAFVDESGAGDVVPDVEAALADEQPGAPFRQRHVHARVHSDASVGRYGHGFRRA